MSAKIAPLSVWEANIDAKMLLAKITPVLVEDVKRRCAQHVAHSTVDKDLAVLKAFFNWCMARNLAASNPVCRVKFFNEDNSRLRYLTDDEYTRPLQAAKKIDSSPLLAEKIILSVHTGLRRGSLFHLRWDQVDFLNRVVRIGRTKSGRPHALPPNATALTTLQALYNERVPHCAFVFAHAAGHKAGEPVRDVKNAFHTALESAGIKDFTWHDLRHTFASWLIMKGASLARRRGTARPSRSARGDALRPLVAGVLVRRSRPAGRTTAAAKRRKGKRRATCSAATIERGESRGISARDWLLWLDSNQQPSG